jgi:drug/metabolite transporter (DMT)-like permease
MSGAGLFAKVITLPALDIIAIRSLIAALTLFVFVRLTKAPLGFARRSDMLWTLLMGVIVAVHWIVFFTAVQVSSVAIVVVAIYTFPVITVLLESLFYRRPIDRHNLVTALIVFGGVYLAVPGGFAGGRFAAGAGLGVLSALLYSLRNVLYRKYLKAYPSSAMMFYQVAVAAVALLPFLTPGLDLGMELRWLYLLALGVVFTAVAHTLYVDSLRVIRASTAGLISCMEPIYAIILAALILGERPGLQTVAGALIVVAAAVHTSIRVNQATREEAGKAG